jgi:hypothetical protein
MSTMDLPLSAGDLVEIAKSLEMIELLPAITQSKVIGRIEVCRPDSDDIVGYFQAAPGFLDDEAWFGFVPAAEVTS